MKTLYSALRSLNYLLQPFLQFSNYFRFWSFPNNPFFAFSLWIIRLHDGNKFGVPVIWLQFKFYNGSMSYGAVTVWMKTEKGSYKNVFNHPIHQNLSGFRSKFFRVSNYYQFIIAIIFFFLRLFFVYLFLLFPFFSVHSIMSFYLSSINN